ncbi:hypothetical protein KKG41_01645 [Patescibacteria group bacterium]|nr:hypothetical protein [Patescibacteria group bacterium]MBU1890480.1 hypothetical protein [Patescibacteria group bacterium]
MPEEKRVHVVGTGTIGEPLIGMLCEFGKKLGFGGVSFSKKQPLTSDRPKVKALKGRGARFAVEQEQMAAFQEAGMKPDLSVQEALAGATVVIDCTPHGNAHKESFYKPMAGETAGFIAQGSEAGFGVPYARGINDSVLVAGDTKFIQVVSCNTHNLLALVDTLALRDKDSANLVDGKFVLIRRANDVSQDKKFIPAPQAGVHDNERFGTHHALDAHSVFSTLDYDLPLFSSAMKVNTQYMHSMHFTIRLRETITREEVVARLTANPRIALTEKTTANSIFSFGRDQGYYGRLLCQTVVSIPTLHVRHVDGYTEVTGFTFTPQDGNSLKTSLAAATWFINPERYIELVQACLKPYSFQEV